MTNCMTNSSPSVLRIRRGTNCKVAHVGQAGCWRDIDDVRRDIVTHPMLALAHRPAVIASIKKNELKLL